MQTAIKVEQLSKSYGNKPAAMQKIISIFPLTQGIKLMKAAFLGLPADNALLPVIVMLAVTVITTGIAVEFFRWE